MVHRGNLGALNPYRRTDVKHRAAKLYQFNWTAYQKRQAEGWKFDI